MKKFAVLALLAAFTLGTVGVAYAVELKVRGTWRVQFNYVKNPTFNDRVEIDKFSAQQRMRTIFEFIASENLRGVLQFEIGDLRWGHQGAAPFAGRHIGGGVGTDGVNIETRHAFINFKVPNTAVDVKAGLQAVALPSVMGSHILAADMAALTAHVPFNDMVGLTLAWGRPHDERDRNVTVEGVLHRGLDDEVDVFFGVLPVELDGAELKPFVVVSRWGRGFAEGQFGAFLGEFDVPGDMLPPITLENATMWHAGLNYRVDMLDPITILGDLNYGSVEVGNVEGNDIKQSGWMALLAVQYAMDRVTPEVFGVYESGEESNLATTLDSSRMPVVNTDGGAFGPGIGLGRATRFAGDNYLRELLGVIDPQAREGAVGLWALGFALRDIQSMDKLSHEFVTYYARGTNHRNNFFLLTTEDSYHEVNFNTTYQIYENLALILELAYGKVNLDNLAGIVPAELTGMLGPRSDLADDALTRGVLGMVYRF